VAPTPGGIAGRSSAHNWRGLAVHVSGGQFPRKSGVGKQSDAVIRGSQLNALNFL